MGSLWIPYGFPMDSLLISYGFRWFPYGFLLGILYGGVVFFTLSPRQFFFGTPLPVKFEIGIFLQNFQHSKLFLLLDQPAHPSIPRGSLKAPARNLPSPDREVVTRIAKQASMSCNSSERIMKTLTSIDWRASLVPAAVIPAPIAY